jgi:hypothetical protein
MAPGKLFFKGMTDEKKMKRGLFTWQLFRTYFPSPGGKKES